MPDPYETLRLVGWHVMHVDAVGGPNARFGRCSQAEIPEAQAWRLRAATIYVSVEAE